jgi:aminoglycoside 6-adenylyltransferase
VLYDRPFRVLLDKDGIEPKFGRRPPGRDTPPAANEFLGCVQGFYAAIMWAKYLIRDDPWAAKVRDRDSKRLLLQMVERDSKTRSGWTVDTWRFGAHLREWAAPDVVSQIDACWSDFSRDGSARSIRMSLLLFEALSSRTARAFGIERFDSSRILWRVHALLMRIPGTKGPLENA